MVTLNSRRASGVTVTAPVVKDTRDDYLAADPTGRTPTVRMVEKNGRHAQWAFEIESRFGPRQVDAGGGQRMLEGTSGYYLRLKMADGPFKGWYLADEDGPSEPRKDGGPMRRGLRLVKDREQAAVFTYVHERFEVIHK